MFFSPDSGAISVLMINQALQKVVLADGLIVSLASGVELNAGAAWGVDDRITFGKDGWRRAGPPCAI